MTSPEQRSPVYRKRSPLGDNIRRLANDLLSAHPHLVRTMKLGSRISRSMSKAAKKTVAFAFGTLRGGYLGSSDVDRVVLVAPSSIRYCSLREFPVADFKGRVIDGDWDRLEKKFEELDIYRALVEIMSQGKAWSDTVFYQRTNEEIQKGIMPWGCRNAQDLDRRCKEIENLYHHIRENGYQPQDRLHTAWLGRYNVRGDEEVGVSIGRHGDMLYCDGAHRLAISKLLRLPGIPVEIVARHPEWFLFRKQLLAYVRRHGGSVDQPLLHPDLAHIPSRQDGEALFSRITENLTAMRGLLVDVDAGFGFFCHKFEDAGFECLAVEESEERSYFLEGLRRAAHKNFRIFRNSSDKVYERTLDRPAVVLVLSLCNTPQENRREQWKDMDLLMRLRIEELFFLARPSYSPSAPVLTADVTPPYLSRLVENNPHLKEVKQLGMLREGLVLCKLSTRAK